MRCRRVGQEEWLTGRSENISRTGVLFRVEQLIDVGAPVEMSLDLRQVTAVPSAEIVCHGRVVRVVPPDDAHPLPAVAASIADFDFVRVTHDDVGTR
jgi:hypothetical protein